MREDLRIPDTGASTRVRPGRGRPPRHQRIAHRTYGVPRGIAVVVVFALVFASSLVGLTWSRVSSNIETQDIGDLLGEDRPTPSAGATLPADILKGRPLNILVIGSDSRAGENTDLGTGSEAGIPGMRADTTMLVHISADRSYVDVVSIPRDTLVDIPACSRSDGTTSDPQYNVMFNSAFETGGVNGDVGSAAACTILTVEKLTGIYIDDFVVVDFAGFINVVDALGGVAMYIPEDIEDRDAQLSIEAGCRLLDGETALGFARARKAVGDGSDISRIGRQQDLVLEIVDETLSSNLLRNPARLYRFLDTSTQTLTTGSRIGNVRTLAGLATSLTSLRLSDITLVTMPLEWAGYRVIPSPDYAETVWEWLRNDEAVDPVYSGDAWTITLALREREAAQSTPTPEPGETSTTTPSEPTGSPTTVAPTGDPTDDPSYCTKENAS